MIRTTSTLLGLAVIVAAPVITGLTIVGLIKKMNKLKETFDPNDPSTWPE